MRFIRILLLVIPFSLMSCYTTSKTNQTSSKGVVKGKPVLQSVNRHIASLTKTPSCDQPSFTLQVKAEKTYAETRAYPTYSFKRRNEFGNFVNKNSKRGLLAGLLVGGYLLLAEDSTNNSRQLGTYILAGAGGLGVFAILTRKKEKKKQSGTTEKTINTKRQEAVSSGNLTLSHTDLQGQTFSHSYDLAKFTNGQVRASVADFGIDMRSYDRDRYKLIVTYNGEPINSLYIRGPINAEYKASCIMRTMTEEFNFQFAQSIQDAISQDLVGTLSECTTSDASTNQVAQRTLVRLLKKYGFATRNAENYARKIVTKAGC